MFSKERKRAKWNDSMLRSDLDLSAKKTTVTAGYNTYFNGDPLC